MKLFFVVLTHPLNEPIPINISKENTINNQKITKDKLTFGDLKNYIWNIIKKREDDSNNGYSMKLWKVKDLEEGKEKWKELETLASSYTETDIENFGGNKLLSTNYVLNDFQSVSENRVHILVQPPSSPATTGGKRPLEDSNEEKENQAKKKRRQYPDESQEGRDGLFVMSYERRSTIISFVEKNHVGLLRSPPSSGKTSLGQTLRDYFMNNDSISIYISLADLRNEEKTDKNNFEEFWMNKVEYTWTHLYNCTKPTYVFVDEIQYIYGRHVPYFWGDVKELMSSECNKNIHVLLLGTYDPALVNELTPVVFSDHDTLSLKALLLTPIEFNQLVLNYVQIRAEVNRMFNIPKVVEDAIFSLTGGHPGLCRFVLDLLHTHYKQGAEETVMIRYLASSRLRDGITTASRAFHWIKDWDISKEQAEFIRNTLLINIVGNSFSPDYDTNPIAMDFIKTGLFAMNSSGKIQFTAPIMRIVLSHRLFTSSLSKLPAANFDDFLTRTIERISPSRLFNSLGKGSNTNSRLFERTWQMEWYRSATTVVPVGASVSADVGPVFGSAGFLDFYVNGEICWGVELTREGSLLNEHARRFLEDVGKYKEIPLKKWVVLDFRHHSKQVGKPKINFWYVLYEDDYKKATIKRLGYDDKVLILRNSTTSN